METVVLEVSRFSTMIHWGYCSSAISQNVQKFLDSPNVTLTLWPQLPSSWNWCLHCHAFRRPPGMLSIRCGCIKQNQPVKQKARNSSAMIHCDANSFLAGLWYNRWCNLNLYSFLVLLIDLLNVTFCDRPQSQLTGCLWLFGERETCHLSSQLKRTPTLLASVGHVLPFWNLRHSGIKSQCVVVCSSIASQIASWISSYKFLHPVNLNHPVSNIPRTKQHISSFHFTEIAANFRNCSTSATSELSGHLEQRSAASENMTAVNPDPVLRLQICLSLWAL